MQDDDEARTVDRRRLLRRAGTVAAGLAGAGAVGAVAASPAQADDGDELIIGQANTGTATTGLTAGDGTNPTLRLTNGSGAALTLTPPAPGTPPAIAPPIGSLQTDDFGDIYVTGQPAGSDKYLNLLYSPTWASMVIPISPFRWVDTRSAAGRARVSGARYDSAGRVLPNGNQGADAIIDFSSVIVGGPAAVQANLTILQPVAQGFASLWDEGTWPVSSSINYAPALPEIANFTQTVIGADGRIRFKTQRAVQFIIDIVGFVVADPFSQIGGEEVGGMSVRGFRSRTKRAPFQR